MKKLRLEDLSVESFDTTKESDERGTVQGHSGHEGTGCIYTCGHCESFVECSQTCHPYGCSGSFDYTFCASDCATNCDDTQCC
ncbi:MAG TPA: pinensin family lanthipeptide [Longimicrobium sp.]|jgi:hypothetical protein|uniref:pinensin family lanthipeptide n=1 Tax=Longimicrobium sp. TaxID=2029185 RepID=UPI002ED921DD